MCNCCNLIFIIIFRVFFNGVYQFFLFVVVLKLVSKLVKFHWYWYWLFVIVTVLVHFVTTITALRKGHTHTHVPVHTILSRVLWSSNQSLLRWSRVWSCRPTWSVFREGVKWNWCDIVIDAPNLSSSRTVRDDCHSAVVSLPLALDAVMWTGRWEDRQGKRQKCREDA